MTKYTRKQLKDYIQESRDDLEGAIYDGNLDQFYMMEYQDKLIGSLIKACESLICSCAFDMDDLRSSSVVFAETVIKNYTRERK
ncbi:MAG: hypothetical protein KAS32_04565 [Candidatus Peribacteraceae bacterium]|nr:hypothetical protein [Candidatus Peribacteraceae bacterium]